MLCRLGMEDCKDTFEKQDLNFKMLFDLSESELKTTLQKMNLTLGKQMAINREINDMKSRK